MIAEVFSAAQCIGYLAFFFGIACFLQKNDRRFKILMAAECVAYAVHFALLGNMGAMSSSLVSTLRSLLALRTRSRWIVALVLCLNIGLGWALAREWYQWLPLIASCIGTLALFLMHGVPMRLVMLCGSLLWLVNNLLSGSIGGSGLEAVIIAVNLWTILAMRAWKGSPEKPS